MSNEQANNNPLMPPEEHKTPEGADLREEVIDTLCDIYDPEIPVNIWELGLIYDVAIDEAQTVQIKMTLTSPACPVAGDLPPLVEQRIKAISGVSDVTVELVWDPPWEKDMMSEAAKLQLGFL